MQWRRREVEVEDGGNGKLEPNLDQNRDSILEGRLDLVGEDVAEVRLAGDSRDRGGEVAGSDLGVELDPRHRDTKNKLNSPHNFHEVLLD